MDGFVAEALGLDCTTETRSRTMCMLCMGHGRLTLAMCLFLINRPTPSPPVACRPAQLISHLHLQNSKPYRPCCFALSSLPRRLSMASSARSSCASGARSSWWTASTPWSTRASGRRRTCIRSSAATRSTRPWRLSSTTRPSCRPARAAPTRRTFPTTGPPTSTFARGTAASRGFPRCVLDWPLLVCQRAPQSKRH